MYRDARPRICVCLHRCPNRVEVWSESPPLQPHNIAHFGMYGICNENGTLRAYPTRVAMQLGLGFPVSDKMLERNVWMNLESCSHGTSSRSNNLLALFYYFILFAFLLKV